MTAPADYTPSIKTVYRDVKHTNDAWVESFVLDGSSDFLRLENEMAGMQSHWNVDMT